MIDLALPRSVVAALWLPHVRDLGTADRAGRAVTGDDEPHVAVMGRAQLNWPALAARLVPVRTVVAALPVPGDPAGVPAVAAVGAIEARECLLVAGERGAWAVVPEIRSFGSALEPGATVSWSVVPLPETGPGLGAGLPTLAEARVDLVDALASATATLTRLDLAHDRPDAVARLAALASDVDPGWLLPPELAPARLDLLVRATRLMAVVSLAREDDGAAVTGHQATARRTALAQVERAARRATSAATFLHRP